MGAAYHVAGYHPIPFGYLVLDSVSKVGDGVAEILYFALYGLLSPDLARLAVRVIADDVGVEYFVDHLADSHQTLDFLALEGCSPLFSELPRRDLLGK